MHNKLKYNVCKSTGRYMICFEQDFGSQPKGVKNHWYKGKFAVDWETAAI